MTDVGALFAALGPAFLGLGLLCAGRARAIGPQARTWLLLGAMFSLVAVGLEWRR